MSKIGIGDSAHKAQDVGGGAGTRQSPRSNLRLMDIANAEEDEDEEEEEDEDHVVRAIFEDNLRKAGLEMELEPSRVSELALLLAPRWASMGILSFAGNHYVVIH